MPRLEPLAPSTLSPQQRELQERILTSIRKDLKGFTSEREDGALIGPFAAMLHFPKLGAAVWSVSEALAQTSTLPKAAHEIAILVVGTHLHARYEQYAHERVGKSAGLSDAKLATITAGDRPSDLTADEALAYDVASVLSKGGQVQDSTYDAAVKAFGEQGYAELVYLIGTYQMVSTLLNAFDVSVPGR